MTNSVTFVFRLFVLAILLQSAACASTRAFTTSSDEWVAYRKTRVSPTFEGRLVAAARYLARYPNGSFVQQTRAFYDVAEPLYFDELRKTPDGLYTYLAALPRGPHADEARQVLQRRVDKQRGPTGFDSRIMALDAQIAEVAARRTATRQAFLDALHLWLDVDAYAQPIARAKPSLVVPWSLSLPIARCSPPDTTTNDITRVCVKLLEETYETANGSDTEEHQLTLEISVAQDASGRPRRVVLGGPDLFVRIEETFGGRTIAPDDSRGRAAGVSRMTDIVRREFSANVSDDPACRMRPKAPAVLDHDCKGLHVRVEAALDATSDDRIVIEPSTAP